MLRNTCWLAKVLPSMNKWKYKSCLGWGHRSSALKRSSTHKNHKCSQNTVLYMKNTFTVFMIIAVNIIKQLIFVTEMQFVLWKVETQFLNIIYVKYKLLWVKHVTDQQTVFSLTHLKMSTRETGKVSFQNNDPFPVNLGFAWKWINQQDAAISQVYYLSFKYSSTCFGHPHAHHQELNNRSSSLWFYRWSVVVAVLLVMVGPAGPTMTNSTAATTLQR